MAKYIIFILALVITQNCIAQDKNREVQQLLQEMIEDKSVAGVSAAYSVDGQIIGAAAGFANVDSKEEFRLTTKVRMGSIAKPMTALAVMQLVEQGKLDLDTPIQTYIPEYPKQTENQITARHLLSHTSGIDGYKDGKESSTTVEYPTLTEALSLFKDRDLLFEPGSRYSYTTYGYTVLGVIIERISGMTFESYMQQNIWNLAGMADTGIERFGEKLQNESALYHRNNGKGKAKVAKENNLSNRLPAGGFYTTALDMLKFGDGVLNHKFVKEETLNLMREHHSLEKENNAYGFGWFLYAPKPNEGDIMGHTGGQIGNTSFLFIVPSKKAVSIILANTSRAQSSVDPVAVALLKLSMNQSQQ